MSHFDLELFADYYQFYIRLNCDVGSEMQRASNSSIEAVVGRAFKHDAPVHKLVRFSGGRMDFHNGSRICITRRAVLLNDFYGD